MASAFDVYSRFVHGQQMYPLQIPQTPKQNFDSVKGNNDEQDETDLTILKIAGKKITDVGKLVLNFTDIWTESVEYRREPEELVPGPESR